jgi:hypothetical protein
MLVSKMLRSVVHFKDIRDSKMVGEYQPGCLLSVKIIRCFQLLSSAESWQTFPSPKCRHDCHLASAATFCKMTLGRFTLSVSTIREITISKATLGRMTISRRKLGRVTISRMMLSRMTISRMTISRMTQSRMTQSRMMLIRMKKRQNDNKNKW